ncbi:MAG: NAD(P)/FAD-dependent oxidoreductase [Planctomycetota bacterium]
MLPQGSRLAVLGGGVAGLVTAHLLTPHHEVTVFEAAPRLGGHTHTVEVEDTGRRVRVDTGFIVFHPEGYPRFTALLGKLGVDTQPTDMGFGFEDPASGFAYEGSSWRGRFADPRSWLRPGRVLALWKDVRRFFLEAPRLLQTAAGEQPLVPWLRASGYGDDFIERMIVPMGAAIWSSGREGMERFPARFFVRFFDHHGMLRLRDRPEWRVIAGGSDRYLAPLTRPYEERIHLASPVRAVRRQEDGVDVATDSGTRRFDGVVLAMHADQALRVLADPSPAESELLAAVPFAGNDVDLHNDTAVMPRRRAAWGSWTYRQAPADADRVQISYWMNRLQGLPTRTPWLVSLNQRERIDPQLVRRRLHYEHPVYTLDGVAARARLREIQGTRRTWYAGAWVHDGFHEDGVQSAYDVAASLGVPA